MQCRRSRPSVVWGRSEAAQLGPAFQALEHLGAPRRGRPGRVHPVDHEAAQLLQRYDVFELDAVTEGAGSGDHRVLETDTAEFDREVGMGADLGGGLGHRF